jgi:N-acetylmuramoyl-L-alanine amidase
MVKNLQYLLVLIPLLTLLTAFKHFKFPPSNTIKTIVIDPGHGGKDPGCLGSIHREKDVSLAVALKLGRYIEENLKDVKVIYTRTTDVFVELEDRALIANKAKADLFISIHCNAAGKPVFVTDPKTGKKRPKMYKNKKGRMVVVETTNPLPFGTETYVMGLKNEEGKMKVAQRENSAIFYEDDYEKKYGGFDPESEESYIIMSNYTSAYVIQSANLAMKIQDEYTKKAGRIDKGVHRQSIWVLWRTSMPSILTEVGYLTNPLEEEFLGSAKGQEYMAKALFRGLRKYKDEVEGRKKTYDDEFENQVPLENENIKAGNLPVTRKPAEEEADSTKATGEEPNKKAEEKIKPAEPVAISTQTFPIQTSESKTTAPKESVRENKFTYIDPKKIDSSSLRSNPDTSVSSKLIAEKFRKEKKPVATDVQKTINESITPKETGRVELVFKVQFASSDQALDLKSEKFKGITDADFYRVGNVLKYTSGKFISIKDASAHQTVLKEKGFKDCFVVAFKNGERIDMAEARKIIDNR